MNTEQKEIQKCTDQQKEEMQREISPQTYQKFETLKKILRDMGSVAIAFSSGVDSAFLLKTASMVLGDRAVAVTAQADQFPEWELEESISFCRAEGIRQIIVKADLLSGEAFSKNPPNRCYLCKKELFGKIRDTAEKEGIRYMAEGSNVDDLGDYRPGLSAVAELDFKSPLREAGLTKQEIRQLSHMLGLPTWDKPSYACLASRFVYGESITKEKLAMVEQAEQLLMSMGFRQMRVRVHGSMARIEVVPEEIEKITRKDVRERIAGEFRRYGFSYVTLDLNGYRTGSMNETLERKNG